MICLHPLGQMWQSRVEAIAQEIALYGAHAGKLQQMHAALQLDKPRADVANAMQAYAKYPNEDTVVLCTHDYRRRKKVSSQC